MKEQIEQLKQLYDLLDETYNRFKDGTVGIEMLIAISQDISEQQKIVNRSTNENNKKQGIISQIPE